MVMMTLVLTVPLLLLAAAVATPTAAATIPNTNHNINKMVQKVTLWNSGTCPYAQRAWIALKEKGIPNVHYAMVDLQNKDATPEFGLAYYKANPNTMSSSKVPVMVVERTVDAGTTNGDNENDNMRYYTESKVVLEVIEELFPEGPKLLPDDIDQRYRARLFGDAVYDSIWGGERSPYKMLGRKLKNEDEWDLTKEEETLCLMLQHLNESLESLDRTGPFVCGEHFSMAECVTAPFVQRADFVLSDYLGMNVLDLCHRNGYERAGAWWKAVLERPSVKETASPDPRSSIQRVIDMMTKAAAATS
ncbi:glutathione S-transferase [Fragilaria crotonensis]|nr:glutathione S-transferase [Fragilaria crotonensis]